MTYIVDYLCLLECFGVENGLSYFGKRFCFITRFNFFPNQFWSKANIQYCCFNRQNQLNKFILIERHCKKLTVVYLLFSKSLCAFPEKMLEKHRPAIDEWTVASFMQIPAQQREFMCWKHFASCPWTNHNAHLQTKRRLFRHSEISNANTTWNDCPKMMSYHFLVQYPRAMPSFNWCHVNVDDTSKVTLKMLVTNSNVTRFWVTEWEFKFFKQRVQDAHITTKALEFVEFLKNFLPREPTIWPCKPVFSPKAKECRECCTCFSLQRNCMLTNH